MAATAADLLLKAKNSENKIIIKNALENKKSNEN
jgi:hypothetical protein